MIYNRSMDSAAEFSPVILQEQQEREKNITILESTEGFGKLTPKQQQIIKQSLYIQQRAERGGDRASNELIISPKTHASVKEVEILHEKQLLHLQKAYGRPDLFDPEKRKYKLSQNHIAEWYCHAAINNLEHEKGLQEKPEPLSENFFEAQYTEPDDIQQLQSRIHEQGYPCVVHVLVSSDSLTETNARHSFLVLGNHEGKTIVWDKKSQQLSYRLTTLEEVCKQYKVDDYSWGIRELKKPQTQASPE